MYEHNPLEADYPELCTVQIVIGVTSRSEYYVQPDLQLADLSISDLLKKICCISKLYRFSYRFKTHEAVQNYKQVRKCTHKLQRRRHSLWFSFFENSSTY
jgi:hypothetical protein